MTTRTLLAWIIGFLAISGIGGSIFFFTHEPNNPGFVEYPSITLLHVILGAFYLALAPLQFSQNIRNRFRAFHRWSGRLLILLALVLGLASLFLGLVVPYSGVPEQIVIGIFGTLFLFASAQGFRHARRKQFDLHREWMLRAFAIALSIATMRLIFIPALIFVGQPSTEQAQTLSIVAFSLAFLIHSSFAEYWIRRTRSTA